MSLYIRLVGRDVRQENEEMEGKGRSRRQQIKKEEKVEEMIRLGGKRKAPVNQEKEIKVPKKEKNIKKETNVKKKKKCSSSKSNTGSSSSF